MPSPSPRAGCSRAGLGTTFVGCRGAIRPQGTPIHLRREDTPGKGLSPRPLTSAQLSGAPSSSRRAVPANDTAALCPVAAPVPSRCPGSAVPVHWAPVGAGHHAPAVAPHLHAAEEGVDGRLLLAGTVAHLLDHGLEEDDGLARGGLQLLHGLPGDSGEAVALRAALHPYSPHPEMCWPCSPSPPGPAAGIPACTPSRCRCSALGSPCGHGGQGTGRDGARGGHGAGAAHPCMSLKQLMQSMDFFSVENMM